MTDTRPANLMDLDWETVSTEFKDIHRNTLRENGVTEVTEAAALNVSQTTVHNYGDRNTKYQLPAYLIPFSYSGYKIFERLAYYFNVAIIKLNGHLHESSGEYLQHLGRAYADLHVERNSRKREALLRTIIRNAEEALEAEKKK